MDQFAGGQTDTPLTAKGEKQAYDKQNIIKILNPFPSHVVHSHLSRAKDTAKILMQGYDIKFIEDETIREIDAGDWAGLNNAEAKKRWYQGDTPNNGENIDLFAHRIEQSFTKILSNNDYHFPFIVAHGRIINALDHIYGIDPRPLQIANCTILKFIPTLDKQYP